ncbi:MAG: nicotinate-nucleotide--dimethylbenzimidazole phosphoribosyltransferase [Acidobacteria bacterium]|nr:nicotinate-nucleotide--dimethylbenzimidazole phosphoribosyltransferase [Acidobacteriota bacterium]
MKSISPSIAEISRGIQGLDPLWSERARTRLNRLTKPLGSLGDLEAIAERMVAIREDESFRELKKMVYVFAADHGVTAEGVSAYPKEVTRQMVMNFLSNGAAINVLARLHGAELIVVDVGVDGDLAPLPGMLDRKVRRGTRNMLHEPAMSEEELDRSLEVGLDLAESVSEKRSALVAVGEMGIGNTTSASAITALLTRQAPALVTGKGAGLNPEAYARKIGVVESVVARHFPGGEGSSDPLRVLRSVGGLEIAAMTGMMLGAARHRMAVVVDGFISTAAAAIAYAFEPRVKDYLFAGHSSREPGHRFLLDFIGLEPILSLNMRLGEGTGALLAIPVIESAVRLYSEMATFASAGVSESKS